ncbi:hypothetical protein V8B97DRAFT_1919924 [Scleroderma yunnanense]
MPQGKLISEDLAWMVVHMYYVCHLTAMEISHLTSLSVCTVHKLLEHLCQTGSVKSNQHKAQEGVLSDNEIQFQFIEGCLEHTPDACLDKLQLQLQDATESYRQYGWAVKGQRAHRMSFYVWGKRYSILPMISIHGMLWCHIIDGLFNAVQFQVFVEGLLD